MPMLIGGVAAISPRTRPFAYGALAAAVVAVAALVVFLIVLSVTPSGAEQYGPGYVK
ncbi:hypothetical protein [Mycobacteroides chelonae]|uniref:hypothetical protein n=1 Tax=Mycobacteroides chelonae TaxID=1774 RepID=UPI0012FFAD0A|nr:hypothetical protein [Mycobacteroides chelonae]